MESENNNVSSVKKIIPLILIWVENGDFQKFAESIKDIGFYWLVLNQPPVWENKIKNNEKNINVRGQ